MRLHRLEITAFGPFAGTVEVDLDRLSEAGLFLLTGPTGAGKTSVLDAVCFALYGDVPGDRASAKRLRCDQAEPGVAPRVELELTLSARRFRLVRSPAWERPKKRGTGTTTEPAHVVLSERREGEWQALSTRLDETGYLVGDLLGMNLVQFTQVAMLPQGRFQAFLRARSDERHKLLQQLFRTGRFEQVEAWLKERRSLLRRTSQAAEEQVADLVSRLSEVALASLPGAGSGADDTVPDLGLLADDGSLLAWARDLAASTTAEHDEAGAAAEVALSHERETGETLERARTRGRLHEREQRALREQRLLGDGAQQQIADQRRLEEAHRAARVQPLAQLARRAAERVPPLRARVETCRISAARALGPEQPLDDAAALRRSHDAARAAVTTLGTLRPRVRQLTEGRVRLSTLLAQQEADSALVDDLAQVLVELPPQVATARDRVATLRSAAERAPALQEGLELVRTRMHAHEEVRTLLQVGEVARTEWLEAREGAAAAHEHLLAVREARIDSMAAELAGALAVGSCCPVCGSDEHPAKAVAGPGAADAGAEREAQRHLDDAKAEEHLRATHHRDLCTRLEVARARTGGVDADDLAARAGTLRDQVAEADAAGHALPAAAQALTDLEDRLHRASTERSRLVADEARREATLSALQDDLDRLEGEVRAVLDDLTPDQLDPDSEHAGLDALLETLLHLHEARASAARALDAALVDLETAREAAASADAAALDTGLEQGFADVGAAVAAYLDDAGVRTLEQRTSEHARRLDRARQALAEVAAERRALAPDPTPDGAPAPDLDVLAARHEAARAELAGARSRVAALAARRTRLDGLVVDLDARLAEWAPVRRDLALTSRLGAFVEGKSADNHLQMRLSAYVLAYRLSQVVAAANERLARMSDRRYSLEHTAQRGAGETRGGLSLRVRDDWSGEARDPATLSGGETFVVSLALALGLADVITAEAGGADLDTLFVDEGFGSLDADTLEDVMDTLDSLREGGRVVGVVSHVAEMRDRIPTQLRVEKSRSGSTLAVTSAGGPSHRLGSLS